MDVCGGDPNMSTANRAKRYQRQNHQQSCDRQQTLTTKNLHPHTRTYVRIYQLAEIGASGTEAFVASIYPNHIVSSVPTCRDSITFTYEWIQRTVHSRSPQIRISFAATIAVPHKAATLHIPQSNSSKHTYCPGTAVTTMVSSLHIFSYGGCCCWQSSRPPKISLTFRLACGCVWLSMQRLW